MEDIGKTHLINQDLIEQLTKMYNAVLLEQEHQLKMFAEESKNIMADQNCELKQIGIFLLFYFRNYLRFFISL